MSRSRRAMRIQLDPDQTQRLMEWAGRRTAAEVEEACEPGGYTLEVHFWALGTHAEAVAGATGSILATCRLRWLMKPSPDGG